MLGVSQWSEDNDVIYPYDDWRYRPVEALRGGQEPGTGSERIQPHTNSAARRVGTLGWN